jgi:predicted dithiol-disulfide oxidoreductase (DUF899 family)
VSGDYRFEGEQGPVDFAGLFGAQETLVLYRYMSGPQRERPCPVPGRSRSACPLQMVAGTVCA